MLCGLRVIRGPGWSHGDADGGEGTVGTVVGAKDGGIVEVTWDGGQASKVKTVELRVLDNATVGVRHAQRTCSACQEMGIAGMRWSCAKCPDCDLCSLCYFSDKHEPSHQFDRHDTPTSKGQRMEPRSKSLQIRVLGIFPEAVVTRGRNWEWKDQDGGVGSKGRVLDVVTPAASSVRSTVKVEWPNGVKNVYRVGFKGMVDLQCVESAPGIQCYPNHLPVLDTDTYASGAAKSAGAASSQAVTSGQAGDCGISDGDKVVIVVDVKTLQDLQKPRSGWAVGMTQCLGKVGDVHGFAANGDAIVQFGTKKFRLVPGALQKVPKLQCGDHVRVLADADKMKSLQEGHGGYNDSMKPSLGKVGSVAKLDSDGDVWVQFGQQKWLYNPACLEPAPGQNVDEVEASLNRIGLQRETSTLTSLNQLLGKMFLQAAMGADQSLNETLFLQRVIEDDVATVKRLLEQDKDLVHASGEGVSAIHFAANKGNLQMTQLLVENGARINDTDGDGDTPLMAACKHEAVCLYLMQKGSDVTVVNKGGQTIAHKAAYFGLDRLLRELITKGADFNAADSDGDTPLHDAISQGRHAAAEVMIGWPKLDIRWKNNQGFPPLHHCAIKDTPTIAALLIKKDKSLVDYQKEDGFTSLHVAAINNHTDVMKVLLEAGATVDMRTVQKQTALHVATEQAYMDAIQLLVKHGADVNAKDSVGNRPLHTLFISTSLQDTTELQLLLALLGQSVDASNKTKEEERIRIASYLLTAGADHYATNDKGQTALDVCRNQTIKTGVEHFLANNSTQRPKTPAQARQMSQTAAELCLKCVKNKAAILFVPCGHRSACRDCVERFKLRSCPQCNMSAKSRFDEDGKELGCVIM